MIGIYILLAISIVLGLAAIVLGLVLLKKRGSGEGASLQDVRAENERLRAEVDKSIGMSSSMTTGALNAQAQNMETIAKRLDYFTQSTDAKLGTLRDYLAKSLAEVKADNQAQLEKMRETVDEKLSSTLEKRFNQSFELVNKRLEEINRTFTELQSLQSGVNDLNKIFKNVKTRGTWGEVALDSLLSQILTSEQYDKQVRLTRGSDDAVDFVIKMPGKGDGEVLLPVDAKFPMEDYARLVEASEAGDVDGIEAASKALANRVKQEAMSIRDKYVKPPKTTDFAIMYLPTEGLYAEIIRKDGLVEDIQNKYRIVVCGPTTIAALLNSLQMGFKSVAIEKRSAEISKLLRSFIVDFEKFTMLLRKTGDNLTRVQTSLGDAEKRTDMIRQKLDKVSKLSGGEEQDMLEPAASDIVAFDALEVGDET
ncbi:MAG: DNA recombination protein RmuC [Clostridia bacterium]|nr:DNA recombination protein RmuC [Clostridia bacterium]